LVPGELASPVQLRWHSTTVVNQKNRVVQTHAVAFKLLTVLARREQFKKQIDPFQ